MMMQVTTLRLVLGSAGLLGAMALGAPAMAQTVNDTDNLVVLANVGGECSVTGATLDFGSYTGDRKDVDVPISFSCNGPSNIAISMDGGTTGDPSNRQMFNEGNTSQILYQLFRDNGRTELWGVFPENSADFANAEDGTPTVFGRIEAGQAPLPGSYADTVLITLTTN
jgi:spore coat protein U domain-containing protein, fimbrial subunit CupE1/2/3/6